MSVSKDWRALLSAAGVGVTVIVVAGCLTAPSTDVHTSTGDNAGATVVLKTITIDPDVGETFAPAPPSAKPRLTAQQAWARYMRQLGYPHHTALPSFIRAQLGLLTLPIGPSGLGGSEAYTAHNELTYGYSTPSGCETRNPRVMFPRNAHCIRWEFLDANTGREIDGTWQAIGHWHVLTRPSAP
jgi:hypothetical protein